MHLFLKKRACVFDHSPYNRSIPAVAWEGSPSSWLWAPSGITSLMSHSVWFDGKDSQNSSLRAFVWQLPQDALVFYEFPNHFSRIFFPVDRMAFPQLRPEPVGGKMCLLGRTPHGELLADGSRRQTTNQITVRCSKNIVFAKDNRHVEK